MKNLEIFFRKGSLRCPDRLLDFSVIYTGGMKNPIHVYDFVLVEKWFQQSLAMLPHLLSFWYPILFLANVLVKNSIRSQNVSLCFLLAHRTKVKVKFNFKMGHFKDHSSMVIIEILDPETINTVKVFSFIFKSNNGLPVFFSKVLKAATISSSLTKHSFSL